MPIPLGLTASLHTASAVRQGSAGKNVPEERGPDPHFWSAGTGSGRVSIAVLGGAGRVSRAMLQGIQEYHHQTLRRITKNIIPNHHSSHSGEQLKLITGY